MRLSNDRDQLMAATPMLGLLSGFILLLVALVFVIFCAMESVRAHDPRLSPNLVVTNVIHGVTNVYEHGVWRTLKPESSLTKGK